MTILRRLRRARRPLAYITAMERQLGPLIWPGRDHTHEAFRMVNGWMLSNREKDCPACIRLYTHHDGCECGHCDAQWWDDPQAADGESYGARAVAAGCHLGGHDFDDDGRCEDCGEDR